MKSNNLVLMKLLCIHMQPISSSQSRSLLVAVVHYLELQQLQSDRAFLEIDELPSSANILLMVKTKTLSIIIAAVVQKHCIADFSTGNFCVL